MHIWCIVCFKYNEIPKWPTMDVIEKRQTFHFISYSFFTEDRNTDGILNFFGEELMKSICVKQIAPPV